MTGSVSLAFFIAPRSLTPLIREAVIDSNHRRLGHSSGGRRRLMLYGAGDLGELFLSHLKSTHSTHLNEMRIIGFIDDHPNLKGRFLDGFRIFGSVEDLPQLSERFNLHGVLLTATRFDPPRVAQLCRIAEEHNLSIYRWRPHLQMDEISPMEILSDEGPRVRGGVRETESVDSATGVASAS